MLLGVFFICSLLIVMRTVKEYSKTGFGINPDDILRKYREQKTHHFKWWVVLRRLFI